MSNLIVPTDLTPPEIRVAFGATLAFFLGGGGGQGLSGFPNKCIVAHLCLLKSPSGLDWDSVSSVTDCI